MKKIKEIEQTINAISIANNYKHLLTREGYVFIDLQDQLVFMSTTNYAFMLNFKSGCFYDLDISIERYAFFYIIDIGTKIDFLDFNEIVRIYNSGKGAIGMDQIVAINNVIKIYRNS